MSAEGNRKLIVAAIARFEATRGYDWLQHPLKVVHANPLEVSRSCKFHIKTKQFAGSKWHDWGKIEDGDWDDTATTLNPHLDKTPIHRSILAHYVEGVSWEKTAVIDAKMAMIQKLGSIDGCSSRDDLIRRYEALDAVFDSIRQDGFRLITHSEEGTVPMLQSVISVSITRYGELMLAEGGAHRLAIAKVLRLPTIPVFVMMRHARWQVVLDRCRRGEVPAALASHPDIIC